MPQNDCPIELSDNSQQQSLTSSSENNSATNQSISSLDINSGESFGYQMILLPNQQQLYKPQPTLLDSLQIGAGTSNLETLTHIELHLDSNMFGVHRLNVFLPSLTALNLDGSSLDSLRDLGTELKLTYLNVSRCGLRSFDGIIHMDTIEHLIADDNRIQHVSSLTSLVKLQKLSLCGNNINTFNELSFLQLCRQLKDLSLSDNPIAFDNKYREKILIKIPSILILDGIGMQSNQCTVEHIPTESSSSLISSSLNDIDNSILSDKDLNINYDDCIKVDIEKCSSQSSHHSNEYLEENAREPIVGNFIDTARRRRKYIDINRSTSASTISSQSSLSSNRRNKNDKFPIVLPQTTIDLEIGLTAVNETECKAIISENVEICNSMVTEKLLKMARKWRERIKQKRNIDYS